MNPAITFAALNVLIAITIVWWPWYARLVRGQVLSIKNELYVDAGRSLGCADRRILLHHILPHSVAPVGVQVMLDIGAAMLITAALGYLGMGARCWPRGGSFFWTPGG